MTGMEGTAGGGVPAARGPVVAIDGPAASGKSTVARRVAEALGVPHLDTGSLYRAVTLAVLTEGVDPADPAACGRVARQVEIERRGDRTLLDGRDVSQELRGEAVTAAVSTVAAHAPVRQALVAVQRAAARRTGAVVEGRDIGTVVLPDADLKVFLTADLAERARRRGAETSTADLGRLEDELAERDRRDSSRAVAPLRRAEDAWELDTTDLTVEEVVERVAARARQVGPVDDDADAGEVLPRVVVVGRPNVGKSTLVNRILGERVAIVEQRPGVTRDRTEHLARWSGRPFLLVDTGGWEQSPQGLTRAVVEQAERAVAAADAVLFVVDATVGALAQDEAYARVLRRREAAPVVLVANKVDSPKQEPLVHELYGLGLGEPVGISARHGRRVGDLLDRVIGLLPPDTPTHASRPRHDRVAVVGRPNVGKSSLFNRLVGSQRAIVHPQPHTTRDAVDERVDLDGEPWTFVDTAGLRRRYRSGEDTELYSADRTRAAIERSDLVLLVVDASEPLGTQDQRLAAMVRDAGRGVVMVLNKWDLVAEQRRHDLDRELDRLLRFLDWAPRVRVSARTGRGVGRIPPLLRTVRDAYHRRLGTRQLNQWLAGVTTRVPPPRAGGRQARLRYVTQPETAPPLIVVFATADVPDSYRRYLERELRRAFGFAGVPVRVAVRVRDAQHRPPRAR